MFVLILCSFDQNTLSNCALQPCRATVLMWRMHSDGLQMKLQRQKSPTCSRCWTCWRISLVPLLASRLALSNLSVEWTSSTHWQVLLSHCVAWWRNSFPSKGYEFNSIRTLLIGYCLADYLQKGKQSRNKVDLVFHPSGVGKSSTSLVGWGLRFAFMSCRKSICPIWQVTHCSTTLDFP